MSCLSSARGTILSDMNFLRPDSLAFPDHRAANREGLLALGGDLSVPRLLLAYRSGIFPWTDEPLTWWSPDPRAIFEIEQFRPPRSEERRVGKECRSRCDWSSDVCSSDLAPGLSFRDFPVDG